MVISRQVSQSLQRRHSAFQRLEEATVWRKWNGLIWWTWWRREKLGGGFIFFNFHPYLGKIPILTNIFQLGWNHHLEKGSKLYVDTVDWYAMMIYDVIHIKSTRVETGYVTSRTSFDPLTGVFWYSHVWITRCEAAGFGRSSKITQIHVFLYLLYTLPKFHTWNLKLMLPISESPIPFGTIFRWTILKFWFG